MSHQTSLRVGNKVMLTLVARKSCKQFYVFFSKRSGPTHRLANFHKDRPRLSLFSALPRRSLRLLRLIGDAKNSTARDAENAEVTQRVELQLTSSLAGKDLTGDRPPNSRTAPLRSLLLLLAPCSLLFALCSYLFSSSIGLHRFPCPIDEVSDRGLSAN